MEDSVQQPDESTEGDQSGQVSESNISMLPVQMTLKNGIVLTGSIEFQQLLTWTPQSTETIRFYMDSGAVQDIGSELISSMVQVTTSPQPSVEQETAPEAVVESVEEEVDEDVVFAPSVGDFSFQNPAASRYLYAPSSIPLQKGQGYTSLKFVFLSGVVGVTDNFTLLVGSTIIPVASVVGGKYAKQINEKWHVGAGAEVFFLPFASAFDN